MFLCLYVCVCVLPHSGTDILFSISYFLEVCLRVCVCVFSDEYLFVKIANMMHNCMPIYTDKPSHVFLSTC